LGNAPASLLFPFSYPATPLFSSLNLSSPHLSSPPLPPLLRRLSSRQRQLYESFIMGSEVAAVVRGRMRCFRAIGVLRKLCNHPDLVCDDEEATARFLREGGDLKKAGEGGDDDGDDDDGEGNKSDFDDPFEDSSDEEDEEENPHSFANRSGKLMILAKILPLWKKEGHRVLIFCQTRQMLNLIERFVRKKGLVFKRMDGNTAVGSRQPLVDRFNNDESIFGMLLTTKTGGVGVNFVGANRIILFDPDWNPQTDRQANERAWRFGQKKSVTVYRLITAGTIEEKIYHRQIFKTALSNKVLQDPRQRRLFSRNDLKDFFTLKADGASVKEGGDGYTETGDLMRGAGVVEAGERGAGEEEGGGGGGEKRRADALRGRKGDVSAGEGEGASEDRTLEKVMKSKGLAGVFDHDFVDTSSNRSVAAKEIEDRAKDIAKRAAAAIRNSVEEAGIGGGPREGGGGRGAEMVPTFTGRFGGGGGGAAAGILAQITARQAEIATAGASRSGAGKTGPEAPLGPADDFTKLMRRLKTFVVVNGGEPGLAGGGPTTDQLLREFRDVSCERGGVGRTDCPLRAAPPLPPRDRRRPSFSRTLSPRAPLSSNTTRSSSFLP